MNLFVIVQIKRIQVTYVMVIYTQPALVYL